MKHEEEDGIIHGPIDAIDDVVEESFYDGLETVNNSSVGKNSIVQKAIGFILSGRLVNLEKKERPSAFRPVRAIGHLAKRIFELKTHTDIDGNGLGN